VLDVGNCDLDHRQLRALIEGSFDATLVRCQTGDEALAALNAAPADLVLVNRQLDHDLSEGVEVIRRVKSDPRFSAIPCMLITNFPEHQAAAVAMGGEPGFGKRELAHSRTRELLAKYLAGPPAMD
jgi:CheY-like chemotaxis protein